MFVLAVRWALVRFVVRSDRAPGLRRDRMGGLRWPTQGHEDSTGLYNGEVGENSYRTAT